MPKAKPRFVVKGNMISGQSKPKGFDDDAMVFKHSSLWLALIFLVFLICMLGMLLHAL